MHGEELAGIAAAVAEVGQDLERCPLDNKDFPVRAVGKIDKGLFRIRGERNIPYGTVTEAVWLDEQFVDERAIGIEDL